MKQRYRSINDVLKEQFNGRTYKVVLDTGAGCPNRDGLRATGGCIFCNERSYHPAAGDSSGRAALPISQQLEEGIAYARQRHGAHKFIAYFQRGSHTYGPVNKLIAAYEAALDHPDVVGCAISTRPDCLSETLGDALGRLAQRTMLWVELGLQSAHDETLARIGRGHTVKDFVSAHTLLKKRGIHACAHIIVGLPGESRTQMIETARFLAEEQIGGVKIHNLHVLAETEIERMYNNKEYEVLKLSEYASIVVDVLEHLSPATVIHRVNSHSPRAITVAPEWSINKLEIFNAVERELERRDSWQGRKFTVKS